MTSSTPRLARRAAALLLCVASVACAPSIAGAQRISALGDDAAPVPKGMVRVRFTGDFSGFDQRYGRGLVGRADNALAPLGADYSTDSLNARAVPALSRAQSALRDLTGLSSLSLSLGSFRARASAQIATVPIALDVGVTRRLTLSAVVPYTETRSAVSTSLNATGREGNVGFNPARLAGADTIISHNTAMVQQLLLAAARAESDLGLGSGACSSSASLTGCAAVNEARVIATLVANTYGTGAFTLQGLDTTLARRPGETYVPIIGTPAQQAIAARVQRVRDSLGTEGTAILVTSPVGALAPIAPGDVERVFSDTSLGLNVGSITRYHLGDIDLAATFLWLDLFPGGSSTFAQPARSARAGVRLRSAVSAGYRLGTGDPDRPTELFDVPIGTGANALLLRSTSDVAIGRHFLGSLSVRLVSPFADQVQVLVPDSAGEIFIPASHLTVSNRTLGRSLELELSPRWALNDQFSIGGQWLMRSKRADRYSSGAEPKVSLLDEPVDSREQRAGFGISYSTLSAYGRGRARVPLEASYVHYETLSGSGVGVPKLKGDRVELRIYTRLWGR